MFIFWQLGYFDLNQDFFYSGLSWFKSFQPCLDYILNDWWCKISLLFLIFVCISSLQWGRKNTAYLTSDLSLKFNWGRTNVMLNALKTQSLHLSTQYNLASMLLLWLSLVCLFSLTASELAKCMPSSLLRPHCTTLSGHSHQYSVHLLYTRVSQYLLSFISTGKLCNSTCSCDFQEGEASRHLLHWIQSSFRLYWWLAHQLGFTWSTLARSPVLWSELSSHLQTESGLSGEFVWQIEA